MMEIKEVIQSLRTKAQGKTCLGTGNFALDIIMKRTYPNGFIPGKRNKFEENILFQEVGNTCGNVMTMLPYLGVKTYPIAKFDVSPHGYQLTRNLKQYGADVKFVSNTKDGGTTLFRCNHVLDESGAPALKHKGSSAGKPWNGLQARPSRKYLTTKNGAVQRLADSLDFTPDVFFFDIVQASHKDLAQLLRQKGTLVYFETDNIGAGIKDEKGRLAAYRAFLRCVENSDIIKFSNERVPDVSFVNDFHDKLFIQTLGEEGVRFKLGNHDWITLSPIFNPDYKDYEGAGDWTSSAFIAAICGMDMLSVGKMTTENVSQALMMAQQIASHSVGFVGSKGMIHADKEYAMMDDTIEMPTYTKKLMYLHGSASAGYSRTSIGILKYLPEDWQLLTPDCPADPDECISMLRDLCEREKPDLIIGCSQGGFYAHQLSGYKRICINPALNLSRDADIKIGKHQFIINRKDGIQSYTITPEMHQAYQAMEARQFDRVTDFDKENCYGLFGEQDTDWGYCKDIFSQYYNHISTFPGGHKMEYDEIETYLIPLIKRII